MLLLDDYYRTFAGFIVLIEKEWVSFGHKFGDRSGCIEGVADGWKDDERSPVFQLFLDCVHQCLVQFPNSFEFNQNLLLFLMEYAHCGWFVNFMFNSERELRTHLGKPEEEKGPPPHAPLTISIWAVVLANRDCFINKNYLPSSSTSPLNPVVAKCKLVFWSEWFLRWNDRLWGASWLDGLNQQLGDVHQLKKQFPTINGSVQNNSKVASTVLHILNGNNNNNNQTRDINNQVIKWADDKSTTSCTKCNKTFSFFWRRHHCRCCGQIFCESCTRDLRIIPSISNWRPSRCCTDCAKMIDQSDGESNTSSNHSLFEGILRDSCIYED